ncbi:calcium-binding protein, partial [Ruminococcus sp.]|uniref:calcium-binding protein n=1 Tax=Ruminococcus sp. TaxID=41978 RepID=UPI0025F0BCE8
MENEVSILNWINGWREAKGLSTEEKLTEEQAKAFLAEFKENLVFTSDNTANVLIFSENPDSDRIIELKEKYEEGNVTVIDELEEVQLINSEDFCNAVAAAVGEEWFARIYKGESADGLKVGETFENQLAIRDFVYGSIFRNSSATEVIAMVSPENEDHVWENTLIPLVLGNKNISSINGVEKNEFVRMSVYNMEFLGYTPEKATQVMNQYISFMGDVCTDESFASLGEEYDDTELLTKMAQNGFAEKYKMLIDYENEVNTLKADSIYFYSEYSEYLDEASKEKLVSIIGRSYDDFKNDINTLKFLYKDGYSYSSQYILNCLDTVEKVIDEQSASDEEIFDDHTNTVTENPDNYSGETSSEHKDEDKGSNIEPSQDSSEDETISEVVSNSGNNGQESNDSPFSGSSSNSGFRTVSIIDSNNSSLPWMYADTLIYEPSSVIPSPSNNQPSESNYSSTPSSDGVDDSGDDKYSFWDGMNDAVNAISTINDFADELTDWEKHTEDFKKYFKGYKKGVGIAGGAITVLQSISNGEDLDTALKNGARYFAGWGMSEFAGEAVSTAITGFCAEIGLAGGWAALAAFEVGFIFNVLGETAFDFIDGLMNGELINPFENFADHWVEDGEDLLRLLHITDLIDWWIGSESANYVVDPLIFDLDNDGFSIIDKSEGAYFDKDNNGYKERIDWTVSDAFLSLDRNKNGVIDNGSELFGDTTYINGEDKYAENGFAALKEYDENDDGVIDSQDSVFEDLRLWVDANGNGISEASEISTLADHNITSISAVADEERISTGTSAVIDGTASFEYADGSNGRFGALWATANYYDTKEENEANTEEFNIRHIGNMPSLAAALANDNGTLQGFINAFHNAENQNEKMESLDNILFTMSGALDIDATSRGSNIDARRLHVVETVMGEKFNGINGADPNPTAANMLKNIYNRITNSYYTIFNVETVKPYVDLLVTYEAEDGNNKVYTGLMCMAIYKKIEETPDSTILSDVCKYLSVIGINGQVDYNILIDINTFFSYDKKTSNMVNKEFLSNNIYLGTTADNIMYASGNADTLIGGIGNDTLYGGSGDDTYVFNLGDGQDTINEQSSGSAYDKIVFGEGIMPEDITVTKDGDDMVLLVGGDGDSIRIVNQYYDAYCFIEKIVFADGTELTCDDLLGTALNIRGDGEISDPGTNYGTRSNNLFGGDGDDILYAYDGDDTLTGGAGNDILYGGSEDDTYVFNLGDGQDTINEQSSGSAYDKIVFGEGIMPED